MSENSPDQTAIFAIVPTIEVPRILELLEAAQDPPIAPDVISLPASRQESARVLGRLTNEGGDQFVARRVTATGYVVTQHATRPTSLIENVVTGEIVEAVTKENLRQVSRMYRGTTHAGGRLATLLQMHRPPAVDINNYWLDPYMFRYKPKDTYFQAIRAESTNDLRDELRDAPPKLRIEDIHIELLTHVCELIEANPDQS